MKKNIFFIAVFLLSVTSFAQTSTAKVVLSADQVLNLSSDLKSNISQEMMGQSIEMKMDVISSKKIVVKKVNPDNYQLDATTTHVKLDMSVMGQDRNFDSKNSSDMSGDMKDVGKNVNVIKPVILDFTGKTKASPEKEAVGAEKDPMSQLMQQMTGVGSEEATIELYFMLFPKNIKQGDTWKDSTQAESSKTNWTYTWESTANDQAIIKVKGEMNTKGTMNVQGMEMNVSSTNLITETRSVGINNGIIYSKNSVSKLNGTADVMGQSIPMTGVITLNTKAE